MTEETPMTTVSKEKLKAVDLAVCDVSFISATLMVATFSDFASALRSVTGP